MANSALVAFRPKASSSSKCARLAINLSCQRVRTLSATSARNAVRVRTIASAASRANCTDTVATTRSCTF